MVAPNAHLSFKAAQAESQRRRAGSVGSEAVSGSRVHRRHSATTREQAAGDRSAQFGAFV